MKRVRLILPFLTLTCFSVFGQNQADIDSQNARQKAVTPKVIILASRPKPSTIKIPSKPGGSYQYHYGNGLVTTIELNPPAVKVLDQLAPEAQGVGLFVNYTTDNGLALDPVACGYKDNLGNLWFGTAGGGVSRYDGKSFTNFTTAQGLTYNLVCSIIQDKSGNLWFGTGGGGVSRYDGKSFANFTTEQGLANNDVYSIAEDNAGNIWFGTIGGGVSRYDGNSFSIFTTNEGLANNVVLGIMKDSAGNLWFASDGGGVSCFDGKTFTNYTTAQGLPSNRVWCLTEDNVGNIWFGTFGGGVSCYDGKSFTNFNTEQGLAFNRIRSISVDSKGIIWIGTFGGGVSRFDGETFANFTTANGLANDIVYSITEDNSGNLWFGTYGGGVSRYDGKSFTNFYADQGLANNAVRCIKEDRKGNLWFGTEGGGVSLYDGKSFKNFSLQQGLANDNAWSIEEDKNGNIWFGTDGGGVSRYDGKSFTNYTTNQGLASNVVLSIKEDKSGILWIGTDGEGVSRYDGKSFTNYSEEQGLAGNSVWSILEDKSGTLWFGTDGGGASRFDGKEFSNFTTEHGLGSNTVWCIAEDSYGNIWFGTEEGGVSRYDGESFMNITTKDGLADNVITQIVFYANYIVFGSNNGIAVLTSFQPKQRKSNSGKQEEIILPQNNLKNSELKGYTSTIKIFNSATGYPVKDVNVGYNAMYLDSKRIIWAATGSDKTALVRIDLNAISSNNVSPTVIIQNLKVNNENIGWHGLRSFRLKKTSSQDSLAIINEEKISFGKILDEATREIMHQKFGDLIFDSITKFYPLPENLVLPYRHNNITFEFAAIEPARPYLVKYQYKLEGYDEDWSPISNGTSASFGNIYEGTYTFKLRACSPDGIWCEPIHYTFRVLPPWYRTWYMFCVYATTIIGTIYLLFRWRVAHLRRENEILEKKIALRTEQLKEANEELLAKNEEINTQMNVIEHKNINITSSIQYAQIIQRAVFPKLEKLDAYFNEHFVLFRPKDIVSGDFYYTKLKGKNLFVAAADCTGHGVPGAFMSVLGISLLNEIIAKGILINPNEILNELRIRVKKSLHQEGQKDQPQDGMDIALCVIDIEKTVIQFAGAHCPLYILRKNQEGIELIEIKADAMPIGVHPKDYNSFTNHEVELQNGDMIYLFTDGYVSQTGGENFELFKRRRFQEILIKVQEKDLKDQREILEQTLIDWQSNYEQVDDILIIGMKYKSQTQ